MTFQIDSELIENNDVRLTSDGNNNLAIEHIPSNQILTLDESVNLSDMIQSSSDVDHSQTTGTKSHDGDDLTPASLEATGTFTDPAGISYSGPINPVQVIEEASTFEESEVTLTQTNTVVSNGSIELDGTQTSGSAIVYWDSGSPADITSWDLATIQQTLDGESVVANVGEITFPDEIIDDFESNDLTVENADWADYSGDTGSLSAQQSVVISGSYSGDLNTPSGFTKSVSTTRSSGTTNSIALTVNIGRQTNNHVSINIESGLDNLFRLRFNDNGIIGLNQTFTLRSSWSANKTYKLEFVFDFNNDEADIIINGSNEGTYSFNQSANAADKIEIINRNGGGGSSRSVYFDDLAESNISTNFNSLISDVSPNEDISGLDTAKNIGFEVNLSRNDPSNNPTVDYLARRFNRS